MTNLEKHDVCQFLKKQLDVYALNLNKNHAFEKISHEKNVNFAEFGKEVIFTQPAVKKIAPFKISTAKKPIFQ